MDNNYKSDLQMIGLIETMQIKLMALGDLIRNYDDPKTTLIEDCSPDSARFVLKLAIAALEGTERYLPITCNKEDNL